MLTQSIQLTLGRSDPSTATLARPIWRLYSEKSNSEKASTDNPAYDRPANLTPPSTDTAILAAQPLWHLFQLFIYSTYFACRNQIQTPVLLVRPRARPYIVLFHFEWIPCFLRNYRYFEEWTFNSFPTLFVYAIISHACYYNRNKTEKFVNDTFCNCILSHNASKIREISPSIECYFKKTGIVLTRIVYIACIPVKHISRLNEYSLCNRFKIS